MLFLKCYIFRIDSGRLYLSIIKPTISKTGRFYVRYDQSVPKNQRVGLPIAINEMYAHNPTETKRRIALADTLFPDLKPGEIKEVVLSITPFEDLNNLCIGTNIDVDLIQTKI